MVVESARKRTRDFILALQTNGPRFDFTIREHTGEWVDADQIIGGEDTRPLTEQPITMGS